MNAGTLVFGVYMRSYLLRSLTGNVVCRARSTTNSTRERNNLHAINECRADNKLGVLVVFHAARLHPNVITPWFRVP